MDGYHHGHYAGAVSQFDADLNWTPTAGDLEGLPAELGARMGPPYYPLVPTLPQNPNPRQQPQSQYHSTSHLQPLPTIYHSSPPVSHASSFELPPMPLLPATHPSAEALAFRQEQIAGEQAWQEAMVLSVDDLYNGAAPFLDCTSVLDYRPPIYPLHQQSTPSPADSSFVTSAFCSPHPFPYQNTPASFQQQQPAGSAFDSIATSQHIEDLNAASDRVPLPLHTPNYAPHFQYSRFDSTSLVSAQSSPSSSGSRSPAGFPAHALPSLLPPFGPPHRPVSTASQANSSLASAQPAPVMPMPTSARDSTEPSLRDEQIVARAAQRRAQHEAAEPPLARRADGPATTKSSIAPRAPRTKKGTVEIRTACWTCGSSIARLVLRGKELESLPDGARSSSACVDCLPVDEVRLKDEAETRPSGSNDTFSYRDTLSAAVDRLEGLSLGEKEPDGPPIMLSQQMKKDALTCDICLRVVGVGSVTVANAKSFTVEVICIRCDSMYQPCSDCGGGGGRLTPGRWRCKELFPQGRRTCILSHARNPTPDELSFEILTISEIPAHSLDGLEARCRQLYFNTRLSTLCRPEFLSRGDGLATTYEHAYWTTVDGWNAVAPHFRENIEQERSIRRYVSLMYSVPHSRRTKQSKEESSRSDRVVSGFFLVELDLIHGTAFFAVIAPWNTTGAAFDSNTRLGEHTVRRIKKDITELNEERAKSGLRPYPRLAYNWLVAPFRIDSRMSQSLERRGYSPFDKFVESRPDTPLEAFPPHREIFIPNAYVKAWQVHILFVKEDDLGAPPPKAPRRRAPKIKS